MGVGNFTFAFRWSNVLTMVIGIVLIGFGVWAGTRHDVCLKSGALDVLRLGAAFSLMSVIGLVGSLKNNSILLWIYFILLFFILVGVLVSTVQAFIITNTASGHNVAGLSFKEYRLQDYSSRFLKQLELNNTRDWECWKSWFVEYVDCNDLSEQYKTLKEYKAAELTPMEAGCCRPPSECGYPAVNASYYDLSFHPVSSNKDCKLYKNSPSIKCYDCDSCKAGVAQYMKIKWRVVAIFTVVAFVLVGVLGGMVWKAEGLEEPLKA